MRKIITLIRAHGLLNRAHELVIQEEAGQEEAEKSKRHKPGSLPVLHQGVCVAWKLLQNNQQEDFQLHHTYGY